MPAAKMHADELDIDDDLVRRLLASQFPQWADLALERVRFRGTDNALFRLGGDMVVRLPRRERTVATLENERFWLPKLGPFLSLRVPVPLADGDPDEGYPWTWSVYQWIDGEDGTASSFELRRAAEVLAGFLRSLQAIDPAGGPRPGEHNFFRGEPLERRDAAVRSSIEALRDELDVDTIESIWESALRTPAWAEASVWIHGDLDARNILVEEGEIVAVIDWGGLGVGDPACDVMVAWKVLQADAREVFRAQLAVDDSTWARARGWALSQALGALSYYTTETNPVLVGEARRWLAEVLIDED